MGKTQRRGRARFPVGGPVTPKNTFLADEGEVNECSKASCDKLANIKKSLGHFRTIPWTRQLLGSGVYHPTATSFRVDRLHHEDTFFGETLNTPLTFAHWLYLVNKRLIPAQQDIGHDAGSMSALQTALGTESDSIILVDVGVGMWGFKDKMHGGAICALLDQSLTLCASLHQEASAYTQGTLYTASLSVNFREPIAVPAVISVECSFERQEGRKWIITGRIKDGNNQILSEARGVWVLARKGTL